MNYIHVYYTNFHIFNNNSCTCIDFVSLRPPISPHEVQHVLHNDMFHPNDYPPNQFSDTTWIAYMYMHLSLLHNDFPLRLYCSGLLIVSVRETCHASTN